MSKKKNRVSIVGPIIMGTSFYSWFCGYLTGSDTVINDLGTEGDVDIYVNSPGGSVFAGFEIVNAINAVIASGRNVTFYISAMAASIASYITTGAKGAKVVMAENGKLMYHAPWIYTAGSKDELSDTAKLLSMMEDDIKSALKSRGVTAEESWFQAGRAKWIASKEAKEMGLIDAVGVPPMDLIAHVKMRNKASKDAYDSADVTTNKANDDKAKAAHKAFGKGFSDVAASAMVHGLVEQLCRDKYGDDCIIECAEDNTVSVTKQNGDAVLLNFSADPLNIVSVDWENCAISQNAVAVNGENDMSKKNTNAPSEPVATEPVATEPVATEPVATEPVATEPVATEPVATEPVATEPVATEPVATEPVCDGDAFVEGSTPTGHGTAPVAPIASIATAAVNTATAAALGLTDDMVAFAKAQYPKARASFIDTIKSCNANAFGDSELDAMKLDTLDKLARLVNAQTAAPKADNSIVASASAKPQKGTATLPPPKY